MPQSTADRLFDHLFATAKLLLAGVLGKARTQITSSSFDRRVRISHREGSSPIWIMTTVLCELSISESLKRTYKPGNCTRTAQECPCKVSRFRFLPFFWSARAIWLRGRSCGRGFGPKTHLSILTTRSIQLLPRSDWRWEMRLTIRDLSRPYLGAAIVSSVQYATQVHKYFH